MVSFGDVVAVGVKEVLGMVHPVQSSGAHFVERGAVDAHSMLILAEVR